VEICYDTVSHDEFDVIRTLRDLHESINEVEEKGVMDNYMETYNDYFCVSLESIIDIIPPKMALLEYTFPVIGTDSTSPSSNVKNPTYIFDNKFIFSVFDRMMHYKIVEMEDSSSIYSWKERHELNNEDNI